MQLELPPTLVFDYPCASAIVEFTLSLMPSAAPPQHAAAAGMAAQGQALPAPPTGERSSKLV